MTAVNNRCPPRTPVPVLPSPKSTLEERPDKKRAPSFFSRISIVPHLALPLFPPPVYSSRPTSPARSASNMSSNTSRSSHTAAPIVSSPLAQQDPPAKRSFLSTYRMSFRSNSAPADPENVAARTFLDRVSLASLGSSLNTSGNEADNALHPTWISRIRSPSKDVVNDNQDSTLIMVETRSPVVDSSAVAGEGPRQVPSTARLVGDPF
ncbi:hypothetical protein DXG01_017207 [Tephrocybe rancida]|nr:hypothetical protein DXG01_017207 [Tephrocybe rancida]